MHELSICQALLEQVELIARQHGAGVERVHLAVGPLSGVEPDLLERAYSLACAGTSAENSSLFIEQAPVRVRCTTCGAESVASPSCLSCAACGDWHTTLAAGDELVLLRVELKRNAHAVETTA
jgi:hydrogenase nickel incorporation protein HypA/HybF